MVNGTENGVHNDLEFTTREMVNDTENGVHNDVKSTPGRNDQELTPNRNDQPMKQFKRGDILWIKTPKHCWWPGQIVDEDTVRSRPKKKVKDGVLVRMYGCYEYLYVDPIKCSAEFENFLRQENLSVREAFQKAIDKDLFRVRSGSNQKRKVSESRDIGTSNTPEGKKQKQDEQKDVKEKTKKRKPPAKALNGDSRIKDKTGGEQEDIKDPAQLKTPLSTKRKASEEPTSNISERQMRVMQRMGLIPPLGSPYRRNGFIATASPQ